MDEFFVNWVSQMTYCNWFPSVVELKIFNFFLRTTWPILFKFGIKHLWDKEIQHCKFQDSCIQGITGLQKWPILKMVIEYRMLKNLLLFCCGMKDKYTFRGEVNVVYQNNKYSYFISIFREIIKLCIKFIDFIALLQYFRHEGGWSLPYFRCSGPLGLGFRLQNMLWW